MSANRFAGLLKSIVHTSVRLIAHFVYNNIDRRSLVEFLCAIIRSVSNARSRAKRDATPAISKSFEGDLILAEAVARDATMRTTARDDR